jgi:hypothetical protein
MRVASFLFCLNNDTISTTFPTLQTRSFGEPDRLPLPARCSRVQSCQLVRECGASPSRELLLGRELERANAQTFLSRTVLVVKPLFLIATPSSLSSQSALRACSRFSRSSTGPFKSVIMSHASLSIFAGAERKCQRKKIVKTAAKAPAVVRAVRTRDFMSVFAPKYQQNSYDGH